MKSYARGHGTDTAMNGVITTLALAEKVVHAVIRKQ